MIFAVNTIDEQKQMMKLCGKSPFGCKIAAIAIAYGFDKKFACFWIDDKTETVYCMVDDVMIIAGTVTNPAETKAFLDAIGVSEIFCAVRNSEILNFMAAETGEVLKKKSVGIGEMSGQSSVSIRDVYSLLEENEMCGEFETFYLDLSHRLRHQAAIAVTEYSENELIGTAVVSAITPAAAIISAVAVDEKFRRQGIGTGLMEKVENRLSDKMLYVFKEKGKNEVFYKKLGYIKSDTWVNVKRR